MVRYHNWKGQRVAGLVSRCEGRVRYMATVAPTPMVGRACLRGHTAPITCLSLPGSGQCRVESYVCLRRCRCALWV